MALQKSIQTASGIKLPFAYIKIKNVSVAGYSDKDPVVIDGVAHWAMYADRDARQANAEVISSGSVSFTPNLAEPLFPQAYDALKKQDSFADAGDC